MLKMKHGAVVYNGVHYIVEYVDGQKITIRRAHSFRLPDVSYVIDRKDCTWLTIERIFLSKPIITQLNDRCRVLKIDYTKEMAVALKKKPNCLRFYNKRYKNLLILVDTDSYWPEEEDPFTGDPKYVRIKLLKILCRL